MRIQLHEITPELQPYIKVICTMNCDGDSDKQYIRVLPDTCVELFLSYTTVPVAIIDNELYNRSIVTFRMSKPMDVHMRKGEGCLAVCFRPGMAYRFFHLPMNLFADTTTALEDIWKRLASEIEERLSTAANDELRVGIVQQYLLQKLATGNDDKQVNYCIAQIRNSCKPLLVKEISKEAGLSQRQLSRKFQHYLGLSPKEFLRVNRFLRALEHLKDYPTLSLTEIAHQSNYYDQAHFIHDCKHYTGYTPGEVVQSPHILY